ncbi:MAG: amidohydrolase family protein [Gemmatimonadetes bacterium]|nr:amidohydrolase family protein [Gemmatimonadota bacterium]MYG84158.1 amidohydrolase family protein [Gemmatimonadota bacterium]MYJ89385.1 amidohydrolase family protein [Gemmatimonadota bacterium]
MIIDVSAWTGPWPALVNVPYDVASVRSSLRAYGVERVFMAPLGAAWSANPHLCNPVVYEAAEKYGDIGPVPVIDPTLPTWPAALSKATGHHAVRMIKLLPGYGKYDLAGADELFEEAGRASLVVMVQIRIDDPRRHHPMAQVPDVPARDVVEAAKRHPDLKLVMGGASAATLKGFVEELRGLPGLYADTSQVDGVDSVKMLVDAGIGGKLLFGSHAPVFMPAAAMARVLTDLQEDAAVGIMNDNAAGLLRA